MYVDFQVYPPFVSREALEVPKSDDSYLYYLIKSIQAVVEENIRKKNRSELSMTPDKDEMDRIGYLLSAVVQHLQSNYHLCIVENPKIEQAIRFITEHYAEPLRNEDIAEELHIDVRHLIRLFTKYMQMPPYQYLTQCRVEHSLSYLNSGTSVTETAFLCGYQSENAFRIAFKKVMGCSPTALLKQL